METIRECVSVGAVTETGRDTKDVDVGVDEGVGVVEKLMMLLRMEQVSPEDDDEKDGEEGEENDISMECLASSISSTTTSSPSSSSSSSSRAGIALSSLCVAKTVTHLRHLRPQLNSQSNISTNQWARKLSRWIQTAVQFLNLGVTTTTSGKLSTVSKTMAPLISLQIVVEKRLTAVMSQVLCGLREEGGNGSGAGGDSTIAGGNLHERRRVLFAVLRLGLLPYITLIRPPKALSHP